MLPTVYHVKHHRWGGGAIYHTGTLGIIYNIVAKVRKRSFLEAILKNIGLVFRISLNQPELTLLTKVASKEGYKPTLIYFLRWGGGGATVKNRFREILISIDELFGSFPDFAIFSEYFQETKFNTNVAFQHLIIFHC